MEDGVIGYEVNQIAYGGNQVGYRGNPKKKAQPKMTVPVWKRGGEKGKILAYGDSVFGKPLFNPYLMATSPTTFRIFSREILLNLSPYSGSLWNNLATT
jgi:hypothetical protein